MSKLAPGPATTGLTWNGTYTTGPGRSVYQMEVYAVDVNNTNNIYLATTTYANGKWNTQTPALPGGTSYVLSAKYYTKDAFGNIYLSSSFTSVAVALP